VPVDGLFLKVNWLGKSRVIDISMKPPGGLISEERGLVITNCFIIYVRIANFIDNRKN